MNEYAVRFPIWEHGLVDPADFPVSAELNADLRQWAATFDAHFDPFDGWDDPAVAAEHLARGPLLRDRLGAEPGRGYRVVLRQWENGITED